MKELDDFLKSKQLPGGLVFAKVWGSRGYNTDTPESDWDFSGVFVWPTRKMFGLEPLPDCMVSKKGQEKPDYSFHEAGKFARLLLDGNHNIIEMLWTERDYLWVPPWDELRAQRCKFLSKKVVNQYLGFAEGQFAMTKKGKDEDLKSAYHSVRALLDAVRISAGDMPLVWKTTGSDEHSLLMSIRRRELTVDEIESIVVSLALKTRQQMDGPDSTLPLRGDAKVIEDWLIRLRELHLD